MSVMRNTQQTFLNRTKSDTNSLKNGSNEREMRSTRYTVNTDRTFESEDLWKLDTLKTNEGREALLKQLDFAVDFDTFLAEEGNLLTDIQKVIQISEL